jgi:hypothetical protein
LDIKIVTGIARPVGEVHMAFDSFLDYFGFETMSH